MNRGTHGESGSDGYRQLPMAPGGSEQRPCKNCGEPFEAPKATAVGTVFIATLCPACTLKAQREDEARWARAREVAREGLRRQWLNTCGLGITFRATTFETWEERAGLGQVYRRCHAYAEQFPVGEIPVGYPSLWLYSKTHGLGKTHLVAAIAHRILDRWSGEPEGARCPIRYETGPSLLLRVRRAYDRPRDSDFWQEAEADIYDELRGVRLLILDDVGDREKESPSEHTRRVYFHVIDQRYADGLPIVFCSNVEGQELERVVGSSTFSRLRAMVGGTQEELTGKDYRLIQVERKTLDDAASP